jgi:hypothetical protein
LEQQLQTFCHKTWNGRDFLERQRGRRGQRVRKIMRNRKTETERKKERVRKIKRDRQTEGEKERE